MTIPDAPSQDSEGALSVLDESAPVDVANEAGGSGGPSRRALFAAGAAAVAAAMVPRGAGAQGIKRPRPGPVPLTPNIPNETPVAPVEWSSDSTRLLRRITFGVTPADVAAARQFGFRGYLERQLDYRNVDDSAVEAFVAMRYPLLTQTTEQLAVAGETPVYQQLQYSTLYRAAFSNRQLYERMVEFWSDHFNISMGKVSYLKAVDDREVVRKHALGKFRDLLYASAKSGAMMSYLDQNQSRNTAPNQNYARELMELHTLGVDGGYTQTDVSELSRVLTGWTVMGRGVFTFNPAIHDWGAKTVLGLKIPAGSPALGAQGILEGEKVLDLLLAHPSTANFIATKMLRWFLTYDPTQTQVDAVAAAYIKTGGDIKSMIRATLNSAWLRTAPMKFKRPFHLIASTLRTTMPTVTNVASCNGQLTNTGQSLFYWDTPDGYPDTVEYWAGNVMTRWNFGAFYANLSTGETIVNPAPLMSGNTAESTVDAMNAQMFASELDAGTRTALVAYLKAGTFSVARVRETMALAISANSFQWY